MRHTVWLLGAVTLLALALGGWPARASAAIPEAPPKLPTRDVDVVYRSTLPNGSGGVRVLEQRMRWAASAEKLRVDPPTPGIYVIMDYRAHRLSTVREATRQVLEVDSGVAPVGPGIERQSMFHPRGESQVAGLTCTEWETVDVAGAPTLACITPDGVLLRAVGRGVRVEAASVHYAQQDPVTFQVPAGYIRVRPPAVQHRPHSGEINP
jgi:hypothetical protein